MFDTRQDLCLCCTVALQFARDQHPWHVLQSLEQLAEKAFGRLPVTPPLHQHIERMTFLVDRAPQVMMLAFDGQHHLVQIPFVAALGLVPPQGNGIGLPELQGPLPDGFVGDEDSPASHQLLDVAKAQRKSKVQPHDMADDGGGIAESAIWVTLAHPATLSTCIPFGKLTVPM